jgi:hypothetical protein
MDGSLVAFMHSDHVQELDRKNPINTPSFMVLLGWVVTKKRNVAKENGHAYYEPHVLDVLGMRLLARWLCNVSVVTAWSGIG